MVQDFSPDDIVITYIDFLSDNGGKIRPTVVVVDTGLDLIVYPITSQYTNKSSQIKQQYFEIKDWKSAGLKKPSWIDIGNKLTLNKENMKFHKIGSLSTADTVILRKFITAFIQKKNL
jgi:hypothetical protein